MFVLRSTDRHRDFPTSSPFKISASAPLGLGNDGRLNAIGVVLQPAQYGFQIRELRPSGDVLAALESTACQQIKGFTAGRRSVVKASLECDVVIVKAVGIDFDLGSGSATTKEVNRSPAANHVHSPL